MLLRKDDPWIDDLPIPDVRDWRILDADGKTAGFVQSVVVDREGGTFEALVAGANERFDADVVEIEEHAVRLTRRVSRRESDAVQPSASVHPRGFSESFRRHFGRTYDRDDLAFDDLRPAYAFGRNIALDADSSGRTFARAEEDVRGRYVAGGHEPDYDVARPAVRFAYELTSGLSPTHEGGLEKRGLDRDSDQILGDDAGRRSVVGAGTSMDTGRPADDQSVLDR